MKKTMRKIVPALAMLLVSASMLSTASYAWFSMNKKVSATGMEVNVVAPSDIKISMNNENWGSAKNLVDFTSQPNSDKLSHASSKNGEKETFFIADPGNNGLIYKVDGTNNKQYINSGKNPISGLYGVDASAYKDFSFYIANTTTRALSMTLDTSATKITTESNEDLLPAMRFAVLLGDEATAPVGVGNVWCGANNERISAPVESVTGTTAVIGKVNKFVNETALFELDAALKAGAPQNNETKGVQKITIRVWIEGTDPACISKNSKTDQNTFKISVGFKDVTASKVNVDASAISDLHLEQADGSFENKALNDGFDSSNVLVQASSKEGKNFFIDNQNLKGASNGFYNVLSNNTYDSDGSVGQKVETLNGVVYVDYKFTVKNNSAEALNFKFDLENTKVTANNSTLSAQLRMAIIIGSSNKGIIKGSGQAITGITGTLENVTIYQNDPITLAKQNDTLTFTVRVWVENAEDKENGIAGQFNIVDLTNETINLNIKFATHP